MTRPLGMPRTLGPLLAAILALLLVVPAAAQPADEDKTQLLDLRRATMEELADIGRQLDEVQARKVSDDWVIVEGDDGEYVQISLERVDELVPWVQWALADLDAAPAIRRAIARRNPDLVQAADTALSGGVGGLLGAFVAGDLLDAYRQLKAGDIEAVKSDLIRGFIRDFFASAAAQQHKAERYAAYEAQLIEQQETLTLLLGIFDAALEGEDAEPSDEVDECAEPDSGCDEDEDGGIEYDALKGLTYCDAGDPDCATVTPEQCAETDMWCQDPADAGTRITCEGAFAEALEPPFTSHSVAEIDACFDDCQTWISWHGSFGDTLPAWCSDTTASG